MKKGLYVLQVLILSLLFIGCNSEDEQTSTPIVQGAKTALFAVFINTVTQVYILSIHKKIFVQITYFS